MTLTFAARVVSLLTLLSFALRAIFGSNPVNWHDWLSGMACAVAIYFLEPLFGKYLRGKKSARRREV